MGIEYSSGRRGSGTFPKHWKGILAGQDSEERAGAIVVNMALDLEARGQHAQAEELRQAFINGTDPDAPDLDSLVRKYVENPGSAVAALDLVRGLGRS